MAGMIETIIEPSRGWKSPGLGEVWDQRWLLMAFVGRDIKARYKQTWIGIGWAFFQPALTALFFSLFLGSAFVDGSVPYPLFVFSGFVPWSFFSTALVNTAGSVVAAEPLIKRVYYPRLLAPLAALGASLVDFLVAIAGVIVVAGFYGRYPHATLLWLPLWITAVALAAAGLGTLLAALSVLYRDVRYLIPFLVQLGLFATPVIFLPSINMRFTVGSGAALRRVLTTMNPLNGLIAFGRALLLGDPLPWSSFGVASAVCVGLFGFACLLFRRVEDRFADVL